MTPDVQALHRRLRTLTRTADRLRAHVADLHSLGWEPHQGEPLEGNSPGFDSHPPRTGNPEARHLFEEIVATVAAAHAQLVGLDRRLAALFRGGADRPDPTRGSTISVEEFDYRLARQKGRPDTPAKLEPQPQHPGRRR